MCLQNVFLESPACLSRTNVIDLLSISTNGSTRMFKYIRQYTLNPPAEIRQKRRRMKMKTFTLCKDSSRTLKTKLNQASLMLSSAYRSLQSSGPHSGYRQTFPYPLALCTPGGVMRKCCKSTFKDSMMSLFPDKNIIISQCPIITAGLEFDFIVDFLFMLHQPPPPDVATFLGFAKYVWNKIVLKLGVDRGDKTIRLIVDKPQYLPPPRQLLHACRSANTGVLRTSECVIAGDQLIPHSSTYQQMLANKDLKRKFITYLFKQPVHIIFDYKGAANPICIFNGMELDLPMLCNQQGEADYNLWFHGIRSTHTNVIVLISK